MTQFESGQFGGRIAPTLLMLVGALLSSTAIAQAQQAAAQIDEITVVGSQIRGAKVTAPVPVTKIDQRQLDAIAPISGEDLFRSIPQMGDVTFNSSFLPNSSNSARGDISSINLRSLGIGNTLVLLNGRRVVNHPTSQADENLVPVLAINANAIPVAGLQRVEVLRDGAAALYGADAVAGVVNNVMQDKFNGAEIQTQYGAAQGTHLNEKNISARIGRNFDNDRGNISLFYDYTNRTSLNSADEPFAASSDKRPLFVGTRFDGALSLDGRSTTTPWASLQVSPTTFGTVKSGTTSLTTSAGAFHIQPNSQTGCALQLGNGICIGTSTPATSGANRDLRYDAATFNTSLMPAVERHNIFLTGHYDLYDNLTAFGEFGYYTADSKSIQGPTGTLSTQTVTIPSTNYWNPFGPTKFADGSVNPNRLANLNIPATGLAVSLKTYNFVDVGPNEVDDTNTQRRILGGLKGNWRDFRWESALLYSDAEVVDTSDGISATLLAKQLALSTPDAYNPFNGGSPSSPSLGDTTPSSANALNAVKIKSVRDSTSTLSLWDAKISKPDLFTTWAGDLGFAAGAEARRETQHDRRDPHVNGTLTFTDPVTGAVNGSDLIGTSPSPDTSGHREVESVFAEFAVPFVSPEMNVPFIHSFEAQIAARFENYSDFGSVAKPKVAAAWDVIDGFKFRGSWAQGFKAPNLEQVNATLVIRSNTRTDYIFCEEDLRAKRITSFANCSRSLSVSAYRSGNPNLKPEESENFSGGVVVEPKFMSEHFGHLTATADYWKINQTGIVGLFGEGNALILDYLLRTQGKTNPNVIRAAPTSDDIAAAAGTGLAPAGQVLYVKDQYNNLLPQDVRGIDLSLDWRLDDTKFGDFDVNFNGARLLNFYRNPSPDIAALLAARASGQINAGTTITGGGSLIKQNGRPDWKWTVSITWHYGPVTMGALIQYTGAVLDTALVDSAGNPWTVSSQVTANLYGQYKVDEGWLKDTSLRLGVRNLTNEPPPLASTGYVGAVYQPYGRYWYAAIKKSF
jgi:outer membrane receptor protein involved in Fe transport